MYPSLHLNWFNFFVGHQNLDTNWKTTKKACLSGFCLDGLAKNISRLRHGMCAYHHHALCCHWQLPGLPTTHACMDAARLTWEMAHARMLAYIQDSTLRPVPSLTVIQRALALQIKVKSEGLWQEIVCVCVQGNNSCEWLFDALEQHLSTSELTTSVPVVLNCCTLLLLLI